MKIHPLEGELFDAERHTDNTAKLIVAFCNFCEHTKNMGSQHKVGNTIFVQFYVFYFLSKRIARYLDFNKVYSYAG
jgi:hypothetical protein